MKFKVRKLQEAYVTAKDRESLEKLLDDGWEIVEEKELNKGSNNQ